MLNFHQKHKFFITKLLTFSKKRYIFKNTSDAGYKVMTSFARRKQ